MPLLKSLGIIETVALAMGLGVLFALSATKGFRLQRDHIAAEAQGVKTSLFQRITLAGLSLAIIFFSVVVSINVTSMDKDSFTFVFFAAVGATWLTQYFARKRKS